MQKEAKETTIVKQLSNRIQENNNMKQLLLGRHSFTEAPSFTSDDIKRKLTDRGIQIAKQQAEKLLSLPIKTEQIISSNAVRAKQTTTIYQKILNPKHNEIFEPFLYHDYTTAQFLELIARQNNALSSIFVVAHNPTISEIAYRLCSDYDDGMQPSTIAVLEFDIDHWNEIEVYEGKLAHIIRP